MPALVVTVMLLAPMTALLTDVPANNGEGLAGDEAGNRAERGRRAVKLKNPPAPLNWIGTKSEEPASILNVPSAMTI